MPSSLFTPSYQDFALQLAQGNWLHSSRWTCGDFRYFINSKQPCTSQILLAPKLYQNKRRATSSLEGNWILQRSEGNNPIGWAELQSFPGPNFKRGLLFFHIDQEATADALDLLAGITSLIFSISRFDHVLLLPMATNNEVVLKLSKIVGSINTLYSLALKPWIPSVHGILTQMSLSVDRNSWRSCTALQTSQRQLKHIELRLQRMDKMDKSLTKPRRKRNILARLFKPTIEDSIF